MSVSLLYEYFFLWFCFLLVCWPEIVLGFFKKNLVYGKGIFLFLFNNQYYPLESGFFILELAFELAFSLNKFVWERRLKLAQRIQVISQIGIMGKKGFSLSFTHEEEQAVRLPHCTVHTCSSVMSCILFILWIIHLFQFLVFRYGRTMVLENKVSQLGFS